MWDGERVSSSDPGPKVLHVMLTMGETSAPYNEHCLGFPDGRGIAICTYFEPTVSAPERIVVFAGDGSVAGFFRALGAALAHDRYDIIHLHSPHVGLLFLARTFGRRRKRMPSTVHTVHSSFPSYKLRNKLMLALCFATSTRVVCCGHASEASFPRWFAWLAGERLCSVANGVDLKRLDRVVEGLQARPVSSDGFSVVAISRLWEEHVKNPFATLSAFDLLSDPSSRLAFIGDGPLRAPLIARADELGLGEQAVFTGLVRREDVFRHLFDADVFISTSRVEGMPVAVLEAMACRCPVVLSDIPSHREIADGAAFIPLVHPDDAAGFARALAQVRDMPAGERAEIGERCRRVVEERFSLERMHEGYEAIYRDLTEA